MERPSKVGQTFSIIIPCYDEEPELIIRNLAILEGYLKANPKEAYEILILENGSDLLSNNISLLSKARYFHRKERGLGWALKEGLRNSLGDRVIFLPADLSYDLRFIDSALSALESCDMVIGSKKARGSIVKRPIHRKLVSEVYGRMMALRYSLRIKDATGVKGYQKYRVLPLIHRCPSDGIFYEIQLLIAAKKAGLRVREIPVVVEDSRTRFPLHKPL